MVSENEPKGDYETPKFNRRCSFFNENGNWVWLNMQEGFPTGSVIKNPPANAGDAGLVPGLGRSPGKGNGNPPQYSCLENPMRVWRATVHAFTKWSLSGWTTVTVICKKFRVVSERWRLGAFGRVEVNLWNQSWEEGSIDPGAVWRPAPSLNTKELRGNQGEPAGLELCVFLGCCFGTHSIASFFVKDGLVTIELRESWDSTVCPVRIIWCTIWVFYVMFLYGHFPIYLILF